MKKIVILSVLIICMVFVFAGCHNPEESDGDSKEENNEVKEITLTKENIKDYVSFEGKIKDYKGEKATIEFRAYSTVPGSYKSVEITLRCSRYGNLGGWHLKGTDKESEIQFTVKLSSNGEYSSSYDIVSWYGANPGDSCEFYVESVSGTFIPSK